MQVIFATMACSLECVSLHRHPACRLEKYVGPTIHFSAKWEWRPHTVNNEFGSHKGGVI